MKKLIAFAILAIALGYSVWHWGFERIYVEPGYMAIITSKVGDQLGQGEILARKDQKGIWEEVLGEGRHFFNPIFYDHQIVPMTMIPPGKVGIVTSKVGKELPEGEFLAGGGEKGIWRKVLSPGKYRINPYGYRIDILDAISVPIGYVGVITSLSGDEVKGGDFAGPNQKGVREDILQPGLYFLNPREFKVDVLEIGVNQVSLLGKSGGAVITKGQLTSQNAPMQELQQNVLMEQNKKRFDYMKKSADLFTSRSSNQPRKRGPQQAYQVASPDQQEQADLERIKNEYLLGDSMATIGLSQFVNFPSRDGFQIRLDMTVEFELLPEKIAWIFRKYGDLPAVVDKIIMPQITSISRNKGSEYRAKDFIVGAGREKFQSDLTLALQKTLGSKNIIIHNALIRHVEVPMQILDPIQQASIAVEQDLTNKERQNTAKKQAELNTELSLIEQRREQVAEETKKIKAEIKADQEKQVATIAAEALRNVAEIDQETRKIDADTLRIISKAEADAITLVEGEKAAGLQLKATAFGNPSAFALWEFANKLNPKMKINIIHAGEGTLWTDLEKSNLGEMGGASVIKGKQKKK